MSVTAEQAFEARDAGDPILIGRSHALVLCHSHDQQMAEYEQDNGISGTGFYDLADVLEWLGYDPTPA